MLPNRSVIRVAFCLVFGGLLLSSCSMGAGTQQSDRQQRPDVPSWYLGNRPMDPHHIFAAATATAPKLNLASRKAANRARGDIAATVETKFEGLSKQFREEVGGGEVMSQFTQTYKSVISQTLTGAEVVKREIEQEGTEYRAYVLMRMPIGQAQEALLRKIQSQRELSRTRTFTDLEQDVSDYEERQREQQARRQGRSTPPEERPDDGANADEGTEDESPGADGQTGNRETETPEENQQQEEPPPEEDVQQAEERDTGGGATEAEIIESRLRREAQPWMGTPYEFGGESRDGVDCSALVQALYRETFDVSLPRVTGDQVEEGQQVSRSQLRPGDLVFFRTGDQQKHVGIYLDDREFVHASSSQGVTISPLELDYWQEHYWTTRRLPII